MRTMDSTVRLLRRKGVRSALAAGSLAVSALLVTGCGGDEASGPVLTSFDPPVYSSIQQLAEQSQLVVSGTVGPNLAVRQIDTRVEEADEPVFAYATHRFDVEAVVAQDGNAVAAGDQLEVGYFTIATEANVDSHVAEELATYSGGLTEGETVLLFLADFAVGQSESIFVTVGSDYGTFSLESSSSSATARAPTGPLVGRSFTVKEIRDAAQPSVGAQARRGEEPQTSPKVDAGRTTPTTRSGGE